MITTHRDIDIASYTTFGIHAKAAALAEYETVAELMMLLHDPLLPKPMMHIGGGSNLLFTADFPGTLLHCRNRTIEVSTSAGEFDSVYVRAAAGVEMDALCLFCATQQLWGLENLSGIPGEAGAAPVQNVGAYGVEAADVIELVEAFDTATGQEVTFTPDELDFGYRWSMFKSTENRHRYVVTFVTFRLTNTPRPRLEYAHLRDKINLPVASITPLAVREAVIAMRDSKLPDPKQVGSAGSFFKNPVVDRATYEAVCRAAGDAPVPHYAEPEGRYKIPAAWLIDRCGWKGRTMGGARVWPQQPLVLTNAEGAATGADVTALEQAIIQSVEATFGITLHPEVEHIP